jgi:hypothetical protein
MHIKYNIQKLELNGSSDNFIAILEKYFCFIQPYFHVIIYFSTVRLAVQIFYINYVIMLEYFILQ